MITLKEYKPPMTDPKGSGLVFFSKKKIFFPGARCRPRPEKCMSRTKISSKMDIKRARQVENQKKNFLNVVIFSCFIRWNRKKLILEKFFSVGFSPPDGKKPGTQRYGFFVAPRGSEKKKGVRFRRELMQYDRVGIGNCRRRVFGPKKCTWAKLSPEKWSKMAFFGKKRCFTVRPEPVFSVAPAPRPHDEKIFENFFHKNWTRHRFWVREKKISGIGSTSFSHQAAPGRWPRNPPY